MYYINSAHGAISLLPENSDKGVMLYFSHSDRLINARLFDKNTPTNHWRMNDNCKVSVNGDLLNCPSTNHHCGVLNISHSKEKRTYSVSLEESNHEIFNNFFQPNFPIEVRY
jgi:hypothetical protein